MANQTITCNNMKVNKTFCYY